MPRRGATSRPPSSTPSSTQGAPALRSAPRSCNTDPVTGSSAMLRALEERLERRDARITIVGQGYVGLPLAMRAAELGFTVAGYDTAAGRIEALRAGRSYVEDVSSEQLVSAIEAGYRASTDPAVLGGFDVAIITVPTPLRDGV